MSGDTDFGMGDSSDWNDGQASNEPTVGVVRVGKRDYAVGLYWNSVNLSTSAVAEAREMASSERISADFFCIRQGLSAQFGLGFKDMGHKSSMPSLAAHVSSVKSGSWIGIFEVVGGYYLIAIRDDGILAESDKFYSSEEAARDAFDNFRAQSDWQETIAPKSFNLSGVKEMDISTLLEGRPPARLREVRRSINAVRLLIAAAAIGGVLIGGFYYIDSIEQEKLREELARRTLEAQQLIVGKEKPIEVPPMPWEGKPNGFAFLKACRDQVGRLQADVPGWKLTDVICADKSVAAAYQRRGTLGTGGGPITWIAPYIHKPGFSPSVEFPPAGSTNTARAQWQIGDLPNIPVDIETMKIAQVRTKILHILERRMTTVAFTDADSNEFWRGLAFTFKTKEDPMRFSDLIGALRGVIITKLHLAVGTTEWTLEGKIYEQLPLPKQAKR
jgi:hypothetical protein